ncbi:MAG: hypothetical protein L6265_02525, partial [Thermoplasmatales archaeon]|nr:hypothetical protein [Candidatus Thermoplasmatota archaeon]MCG2825452.1 hypothetical protein [Thermoplasmatales archaeon]
TAEENMNIKPIVFQAWNLITDGSMSAELQQEKDIVRLSLDPNVFSVDIEDVKHPIILALKDMGHILKKTSDTGVTKEETPKPGGKTKKIFDMLHKIQGAANTLAENKKTFILKHKGKELLKIGEGAISLLPVLRKKHIQIPNKIAMLRFLMEIR